jgi:multiple sugar transport system substrate-binding protein
MKKTAAIILTVLVLCTSLWANGQQDAKTDGPKTISYAFWDKNQEPGMRAMAEAFMAENPDITVELQVSSWSDYWTKLEASTLGGNMPDVFWMHVTRFYKYADAGKLMPLSDRIGSASLDMSKYPAGVTELYAIGDEQYGIPKDFDTIGLVYNKEMFDAAGIAYPDASWDWNKLVDVARELTDTENGSYGYAAAVDAQEVYYNYILQNNGTIIDYAKNRSGFDSPETMGAIQHLYDMIHKYKISPTVQQMADTKPNAMFSSGKLAMYFTGAWNVTWLTKNEMTSQFADLAVLPMGKRKATVYNGLANSVAADSNAPDAAWRFVEYLGSKEAQLISAAEGSAIPAYEGTQTPWINYNTNFNLNAFVEQLEDGFVYPFSKRAPKYLQFEKETMVKIMNDEIGVEEGCRAIADRVNEVLAD